MSNKKLGLLTFLTLCSIVLGGVLGTFDFYQILTGDRFLNIGLFVFSLLLSYFASITIFLLDFSDKKDLTKAYIFVSFFFGLTFYLVTKNVFIATLNTVVYFMFLYYLYSSTVGRARLFVKFIPDEIFFPSLKRSFLYLIMLYAFISFMHTQRRISENNLITPRLIRVVAQPITSIINKQFSAQIQSQLPASTPNRESVVKAALSQTVDSFTDTKTGTVYGVKRSEIPVEKTSVLPSGEVDIAPVVDANIPRIAAELNTKLLRYQYFAPLLVGIIILFILQPVFFVFQLVEAILTRGLFKLLLVINFISIRKETQEVERIIL